MPGGFQIVFEALDEASPTIQQLSQQLTETAANSNAFASQVADGAGKVGQAFGSLPAGVEKAASSMSSAQEAAKELLGQLAGVASVAEVVEFFKSSAEAAIEEEGAMTRLAFAVNSTGGSFAAQKSKITEFAEEQASMTRFSETQTLDVMSRLVRVTGDVGQAMTATKVAMGMAATSGLDLNTTVGMLAPLLEGNTNRLSILQKQFGAYVGDTKDAQTILNNLSKAFLNAAENQNDAGTSIAKLKNQLQEFQAQVGEGVIPGIQLFLSGLVRTAEAAEIVSTEIAKFAVEAMVRFQELGNIISDVWNKAWGKIAQDTQSANEQIAAIQQSAEESELAIVQRYSTERVKVAQGEAQLKAKVITQAAQETATVDVAAQQKAQDALIKLQEDLLKAHGQFTAARMVQIQLEHDRQLQSFQDMHDKGLITDQQLATARQELSEKMQAEMAQESEAAKAQTKIMQQAYTTMTDGMQNAMSSAISDMILKGESFDQAMKVVFNDLMQTAVKTFAEIAVRSAMMQAGLAAATGGAGAALPVGLPGLAAGGVVTQPTAAIVGESGPEAVIPLSDLQTANAQPSVQVNVTQNNTIQLAGVSDSQIQDMMRQMAQVTRSGAAAGAELVKSITTLQSKTQGLAV